MRRLRLSPPRLSRSRRSRAPARQRGGRLRPRLARHRDGRRRRRRRHRLLGQLLQPRRPRRRAGARASRSATSTRGTTSTSNGQDNRVADVHGIVGRPRRARASSSASPSRSASALYLPDTGLSRVKALRQETPRWALYDERAVILFLAANLAIRPLRWLEIGGGVAFLAATTGPLRASRGTADILNPYDSQLRHEVDADLTAVRYPQVGARVQIDGLGYLGARVPRPDQARALRSTPTSRATSTSPASSVPLALRPRLAAPSTPSCRSRSCSGAELPERPAAPREPRLHLRELGRLREPHRAVTIARTSPSSSRRASRITLPPTPSRSTIIPPALREPPRPAPRRRVRRRPSPAAPRTSRATTIERRLVEIPIRAGYVYERSPVPPQTGVTNFVDTDRHTLSLGAGLTINAPGSRARAARSRSTCTGRSRSCPSASPTRTTRPTSSATTARRHHARRRLDAHGGVLMRARSCPPRSPRSPPSRRVRHAPRVGRRRRRPAQRGRGPLPRDRRGRARPLRAPRPTRLDDGRRLRP